MTIVKHLLHCSQNLLQIIISKQGISSFCINLLISCAFHSCLFNTSSSIENQLLLSFSALRCDLLSILRCFTSHQLHSADPIPRWFDVDLHATIPKTSVCGNEYFACQLADLPATASEVLKQATLLNITVLFLQCLNSSQNKSVFIAMSKSTS